MFDLQQVPCYDSTSCDEMYNCSPSSSSFKCPGTNTEESLGCSGNQIRQRCYGSDPNYCSGIIKQCDPNDGYYCKPNVSNPAQNYFSENLGCNVKTDPGCLEFENDENCQTDCWNLGGYQEVNEVCNSQFKDQDSCDAMKYFCKWDNINNSCKSIEDDPWTKFINGPKGLDNSPKKIFTENLNSGYKLDCSQSSWSSDQVNSYADTIRTCCISKPGTDKKCVTTPRCQFVSNTCECGFKDIDPKGNPSYNANTSNTTPIIKKPLFICENTEQSLITNDNSYTKKGYCTWCKGSQLKNFDYREWLINNKMLNQGENIRSSIAWGTKDNCKNRCSNYNKCENDTSEKLWNDCIQKHSNGTVGITDNGNDSTDFTKGFCYVQNCLEHAKTPNEINKCNEYEQLKNICENELATTVSTKNELMPVSVNDLTIVANRCTEGTNWTHSCSNGYAQNYACGWCPNLQNDWSENPCTSSQELPKLSNPEIIGVVTGIIVGSILLIFLIYFLL